MQITDSLYAHVLACAYFNKALLIEPSLEMLGQIGEQQLFDAWPVDSVSVKSHEGLAELRTFFRTYSDAYFKAVKQDHGRLFVGPADSVPVWESYWTTKDRLLFDAPTLAVRAFYAQYGLEIEKLGMEPDDHIGYEFAFMGHLLSAILAAAENGDQAGKQKLIDAARRFYEKHLGAWAPRCLRKIAAQAESGFYRGTALLGLGYLEELGRLLNALAVT